jgi:hypothetical protein
MTDVTVQLLPSGRPEIHLPMLLKKRDHPEKGKNLCVCVSLTPPVDESFKALVNGLRRILPFVYHSAEQVVAILARYGLDFAKAVPLPTAPTFQWAHAGEILMCAYFEECENTVSLTYKWRLNTSKNQHQLGMDLLAFDLSSNPPRLYAIAVKTTSQGGDGRTPSVISNAIKELKTYIGGEKLDDDLAIIAANLHTNAAHRDVFLKWYDPYAQDIPAAKPELIAVPGIVIDEKNWHDGYAKSAIEYDFGIPGAVRVLCVKDLESLVNQVYA